LISWLFNDAVSTYKIIILPIVLYVWNLVSDIKGRIYRLPEKSGTNGNFIFYLHYMLYMFTPTLYAFYQPLYHVCADFSQHTGIDSSTTVCNSLPKVTKISDFNSIHQCLQESPKCKVSTLSSSVDAMFSLLTFNFNP
jgi:hypothetical protein